MRSYYLYVLLNGDPGGKLKGNLGGSYGSPWDNHGVPSSSKEMLLSLVNSRLLRDNGAGPTSALGFAYEVDEEREHNSRKHRIPVTLRRKLEAKLNKYRYACKARRRRFSYLRTTANPNQYSTLKVL